MEQSYGYVIMLLVFFGGCTSLNKWHANPTYLSQDADGSGTLHVSELVHGLLKIRGDIKFHGRHLFAKKTRGENRGKRGDWGKPKKVACIFSIFRSYT